MRLRDSTLVTSPFRIESALPTDRKLFSGQFPTSLMIAMKILAGSLFRRHFLTSFCSLLAFTSVDALLCAQSNEPISSTQNDELLLKIAGATTDGLVGKGKKVVLVSGDEEYRSEESLPMIAKILADQHGFDCVVLFSINPKTNTVDPNHNSNIPGLENLEDADAMVLFTRMRSLPDDQMSHFEKFVKSGKPFIAIRTATHPFAFGANSKSAYRTWSWDYRGNDWPGGFGQQIIGETWHSHHGIHNGQATRGIIPEKAKQSPILRGVTNVFGPTDVYGVVHLPDDANILMYGQVVDGMKESDPPLDGPKNDPMMPLVWTKEYQYKEGSKGKVLCTTIGSAVDFLNEDLRRLVVNSVYWATGLEDKIPEKSSVLLPSNYKPTYFGFKNEPGYFSNQRIKPSDLLPKE